MTPMDIAQAATALLLVGVLVALVRRTIRREGIRSRLRDPLFQGA